MRNAISLIVLCATLASCGETHAHDDESSHATDATAGTSDDGHLLISYVPYTPLGVGHNMLDIEVREIPGAPLSGATVTLEFVGPEDAAVVATTGETDPGTYRSAVVPLAVSGDWRMTVHVTKASVELHDHITFQLAVP